MTRTTDSDLEAATRHLNHTLERKGSSARALTGRRNGYVAIDIGDADGSIQRHLYAGRAGEVLVYLRAMREGLWLLEPPYRETFEPTATEGADR